ncbi:MAG TPA: DMT family transporter [Jatrophihabitans sp.]|nr:DMT family transporter [Jatrophihabitans sp.]
MAPASVLLALVSALLYGMGVGLEHRQAARTPAAAAGRPGLVMLLTRQPMWLLGAAFELGGFATHAAALGLGSFTAVQLILSCSLVVSVFLNGRLSRRPLGRRSWAAVLAVVAGVGAASALLGAGDHGTGRLASAALVTGLVAAPVAIVALLSRGSRRAVLLGCAAGLADAFVAVVTAAFAHAIASGVVLTSWPAYVLLAGGLVSLVITQSAYQVDEPLTTLPLIASVMPLATLAIGLGVLGESGQLSGTRGLAAAGFALLAVTGLTVLARATPDAHAGRRQDPRNLRGTSTHSLRAEPTTRLSWL